MAIVFTLTAHKPSDERVWFQQAATLQKAGYNVLVRSLNTGTEASIKASTEANVETSGTRDVIICDTPKAVVLAAIAQWRMRHSKQRAKILYDITEWYPSKKNLRGLPFYRKIFKFILLTGASLLAAFFASGFIFGEYFKAIPFRRLFFWKKYIYLPYYAHTKNVKHYPVRDISRECVLLYAGRLTREKGFYTVLDVTAQCARLMPDTHFILRIISDDKLPSSTPPGFTIEHIPSLPFPDFCAQTGKADICVDLRHIDWENNRCLPIKIFYYLASGRPVIYSDLKAIRKEIPEIESTGILVNPACINDVADAIISYIIDNEKYKKHCLRARELAQNKYDWSKYEKLFINFIAYFTKKQ
ncbi:MAG: glycosyltransferase [Bacteroidales bacterium]|jgi:glycosyltransferase involved in cell wall biosynthesis|nr:glycosyltransferase [Bacteroidales bacterium]